jgi:hypothetical protein
MPMSSIKDSRVKFKVAWSCATMAVAAATKTITTHPGSTTLKSKWTIISLTSCYTG